MKRKTLRNLIVPRSFANGHKHGVEIGKSQNTETIKQMEKALRELWLEFHGQHKLPPYNLKTAPFCEHPLCKQAREALVAAKHGKEPA